jgi:hypothetical protein
MRYVLLVLAIPAAVIAYLVTGQLLVRLPLAGGIRDLLVIFLPLFVAGLVAVPFIAPFVDAKAKQALADAPRRSHPAGHPDADEAARPPHDRHP